MLKTTIENAQGSGFVKKINQANNLKAKGVSWIGIKRELNLEFKEWIKIMRIVEKAAKRRYYKIN